MHVCRDFNFSVTKQLSHGVLLQTMRCCVQILQDCLFVLFNGFIRFRDKKFFCSDPRQYLRICGCCSDDAEVAVECCNLLRVVWQQTFQLKKCVDLKIHLQGGEKFCPRHSRLITIFLRLLVSPPHFLGLNLLIEYLTS